MNYPKPMKAISIFDSFKGCMTAKDACHAAAEGLQQCVPDAKVVCLPMSDGGEGMVECIAEATGIDTVSVRVNGPMMNMVDNADDAMVDAQYAISADGKTAYMEMAAASGLILVPEDMRNPMLTTTYGVGEMILDAVARGCSHIVMGIGGSATSDGGKGMVECLMPHLPLPVDIVVASDVNNPLYGTNGAAYVYAPQKGATPEQVVLLDQQLRDFARKTEELGIATPEVADCPGAGAAGGLGYGLMAYLGAKLTSGIDLILDIIGFDDKIKDADLILTGEGKSDRQTLMGKVPMGILKRAKRFGIPVYILSGCIEERETLIEAGFADARSINEGDQRPLAELMRRDVAMANLKTAACHYKE